MKVLRSWVGMLIGTGGFQEFPNCMASKESVEHLLFECASCNSHAGPNFVDSSNIYNKAQFYLGEKQGMLINDECTQCSSLYNKSEDKIFDVSLENEEGNFVFQ